MEDDEDYNIFKIKQYKDTKKAFAVLAKLSHTPF
jgi:hypothetical protein